MDYIYSSNEVWTTLDDPANATTLSYDQLLSEYDKATANNKTYLDTINKLMHQIDHLEQYLTDGFESIDEDTLQALAEIFEFDLTRPVDITLTIEAQVTVNLPLGKSIDDIDGFDFNVDIDSYEHEVKYVDISDINAE